MAKYDSAIGSSDYVDRLPGIGAFNPRSMTAPGSDGPSVQQEAPEAHIELGTPIITTPHSSSQVAGDNPTTVVEAGDSAVPGQVPEQEPFTSVDNTWRSTFPGDGTPSSHVVTPSHPNSNGLPR